MSSLPKLTAPTVPAAVVLTKISVAPVGMTKVTVLSVEVEAVLSLPAPSSATLAATVAITVPSPVMPLTATL